MWAVNVLCLWTTQSLRKELLLCVASRVNGVMDLTAATQTSAVGQWAKVEPTQNIIGSSETTYPMVQS